MRKIKLILEYDGTDFVGWQIQSNGRSVQEVVEGALHQLLGAPVRLVSSGRTDAGVHAVGMVAHFMTDRMLPIAAFREGLNRFLPNDVAVRSAAEVDERFHARFNAVGKWYRYAIHQRPVRSPLFDRTAWGLRSPLNLEVMRVAARDFIGSHDFGAFRSSGCDARTTCREIFSVEITVLDQLVWIDVKGSGFLRNMVRIMVGTLVEIGQGRRPATDVARLLAEGCRETAGITAPPEGLCLMEVWYDSQVADSESKDASP